MQGHALVQLQVAFEQRAQPTPGVGLALEQLFGAQRQGAVELLNELEQQRLLALDMVVQRAGGNTHVGGQVAHADATETTLGEQLQRRTLGILIAYSGLAARRRACHRARHGTAPGRCPRPG